MADWWEPHKTLNLYILDYMRKKNMHMAAEIFAKEADVPLNPVGIDSPRGFLTEWWSIFWEMYASRMPNCPAAIEQPSVEMTRNELQSNCSIAPWQEMNQQRYWEFPHGEDFNKMISQPVSQLLAAKMLDGQHLRLPDVDLNSNMRLDGTDRMNFLRPTSSNASIPQQQISKKGQQQVANADRTGVTLGRSIFLESNLQGFPYVIYPRTGPSDAGQGMLSNPMALKGWPSTEPNQRHHSQTLNFHHDNNIVPPVLAQAPGMSSYSLPESNSNIANLMIPMMFPMQQNPDQHVMVPARQIAELKMAVPIQQTEKQQQKEEPNQQQLLENSRKRKSPSSSIAGECSLVIKDAEVDKQLDEDVESFLSHDEEISDNISTSFSTLMRSSAHKTSKHKGFSFEEIGTFNSFKSKVLCCHFSSDGKLLASAGHERKVLITNNETFNFATTTEGHSHLITDVRFRQNSTVFATSSFDRTVQIWNAAKPSKSLFKLLGHAEHVMSLDFHPRKLDLLCSCDSSDEIRLWDVNQCVGVHIFKGASRQVRFQPGAGNLLAASSGNVINLIDVETNSIQHRFEGHVNDVRSISWDISGKYMVSVSEDSVRVWSVVSGGKCIHELHSNGNKFESCTFHPGYSQLVVTGSYQTLELWNPTVSHKTLTVSAHKSIISALAGSPQVEMIASASHDPCVKLWK